MTMLAQRVRGSVRNRSFARAADIIRVRSALGDHDPKFDLSASPDDSVQVALAMSRTNA